MVSLSSGVQGYCSYLSDKTYLYPLSGFIIELLHKRSKSIVAQRSWVPLGERFAGQATQSRQFCQMRARLLEASTPIVDRGFVPHELLPPRVHTHCTARQ